MYLLILSLAKSESLSDLMRSSEESPAGFSATTSRLKSVECFLASETFVDQQLATRESPLFGHSEYYLLLQVKIRAFEACLEGKEPGDRVDLATLIAFPKAKVSAEDSQLFSRMQQAKEDLEEVRSHYDDDTGDGGDRAGSAALWAGLGLALAAASVLWNRLRNKT